MKNEGYVQVVCPYCGKETILDKYSFLKDGKPHEWAEGLCSHCGRRVCVRGSGSCRKK